MDSLSYHTKVTVFLAAIAGAGLFNREVLGVVPMLTMLLDFDRGLVFGLAVLSLTLALLDSVRPVAQRDQD